MKNFKLKRVWVEDQLHEGAIITIVSKEKIHHLTVVLKIKRGENLRLFNEKYGEFLGEVQAQDRKEITIKITDQLLKTKPENNITIGFAPLKPDALRFLIEKATEIGAYEFIPVITERTIIRHINPAKLHAYTLSAAEQSERLSVPEVKEPVSLKDFVSLYDGPILFCNERSNSPFIKTVLKQLPTDSKLIVLIGPEGGFTQREQDYLMSKKNIHSVSLGENILRAETAALFVLSCIIFATQN